MIINRNEIINSHILMQWTDLEKKIWNCQAQFNYTDACGLNPFAKLSFFATRLLVLSWSNACRGRKDRMIR